MRMTELRFLRIEADAIDPRAVDQVPTDSRLNMRPRRDRIDDRLQLAPSDGRGAAGPLVPRGIVPLACGMMRVISSFEPQLGLRLREAGPTTASKRHSAGDLDALPSDPAVFTCQQ